MTTNKNLGYTLQNVGCYIDGVIGIYVGKKIQEMAQHHGWEGQPYLNPRYLEYDDATQEAIDFMNARHGVEGAYWGWNDGDFGLYLVEDGN